MGKARTRPNILRVVLGPYGQYCLCKASEKKLGQKPKSELKEIELSYCQWPSYGQNNVHVSKVASGLFCVNWWPFWANGQFSKLAILSPKILHKITIMAISQNPILPKCHSPKSLLLLNFSMNLSKCFRINVNIDFAHTNRSRFFYLGLQKKFWAQNLKKPGFFKDLHWFWNFQTNSLKNVGGVGFLVNDIGQNGVLRYGYYSDFWSIFGDRMANFDLIDFKFGLYIKGNVTNWQNKFEVPYLPICPKLPSIGKK